MGIPVEHRATCSACDATLPAEARFCPACGAPTSDTPAERRLVTAFFCDVVGSTTLAERLDTEVLGVVMSEYTALARAAIERNGGTVASFHGDGAVGLFGLPTAHEDDAARAARAGLDLLASLSSAREAAAHGIVLQARVGIETGEVLGDLAMAASGALAGDVLNTAARLQAETEPGTVIAGEAAVRLLRDRAELRELPPVRLKGKAETVTAAQVVSVDTAPRRVSTTPLIGRERHLASLHRALDEAIADGAPVLATILGEPGIGKTRVLDAFLGDVPTTTVLRTSVPAAGEGGSLDPVADLIRDAAGGDSDRIADRLAALLRGRPDAATLEGALGALLGLGGEGAAEHTWALRRLLETLAARRPLVVALDDLHWASAALIELVEDVARWTHGPVLVLCAARPDLLDVHRSWGGGLPRALTITVGPLGPDGSRALAEALLGQEAATTQRLVDTAEGNPLFLEQLAAEASELGDAWDPTTAPTTIRALLEARLDRCSPELARALAVASVQGTRFDLDVVRALIPRDVDLTAALREAERANLAMAIEPDVGAFAHALIRETAYRRIPKATRADLHTAIAGLLPDEEDEPAGVHLERAARFRAELGHPDPDLEGRAGERLARTGARAFARMDLVSSSELLARAARLLPDDSPARLDLLPDLAVALMENGRAHDAESLLAGAVETAEHAGSRRDAIRIRLQKLALYVYVDVTEDEIRRGIVEGRALLEELSDLGDDVGLAQGWIVLDYLHWLVGEFAAAHEAAGRSVAHAERAGRLREQVQAGGDQATSLLLGPASVAETREIGERRRESPNPVTAAGGHLAVAVSAALVDDRSTLREARSAWRRAVETGGLEWPGAYHAMTALAPTMLEIGDPAAAEAYVREGIDTMERLGDVWILNGVSFFLPLALARQDRVDEAALLVDVLDDRYVWMGAGDEIIRVLALSAVASGRGRAGAALALANDAAELARSTDSNLLRSLALEHMAGLLYDTDPVAAIETIEEVAAIDAAWGNVVGGARVARSLEAWNANAAP